MSSLLQQRPLIPQESIDAVNADRERRAQAAEARDGVCYAPGERERQADTVRPTPELRQWDGVHRPYSPAQEWSRPGGGYDRAMAPWKMLNSLGRLPQRPGGPAVPTRPPMTQR